MSHMPEDPQTPPVLAEILEAKRAEIERRKAERPMGALEEMISELGRPRNFFQAVTAPAKQRRTAVIAEIKRKSPSAGWMRPEYEASFDPVRIARSYHEAGAHALSILTDEPYFAGDLGYIHRVRDVVNLPVLRKDFIIDPYQVYEARAFGADAILLIAECLSEGQMLDLMILARQLQLTTLVEVHSMENLLRVRPHVSFPNRSYMLLGINNRDLTTMTTDLAHTLRLVDMVEDRSILVSESGIKENADLKKLHKADVRIVLVGESLMRDEDPGAALKVLLDGSGA
jgi:indole-3-glycerol phosphate synthase